MDVKTKKEIPSLNKLDSGSSVDGGELGAPLLVNGSNATSRQVSQGLSNTEVD